MFDSEHLSSRASPLEGSPRSPGSQAEPAPLPPSIQGILFWARPSPGRLSRGSDRTRSSPLWQEEPRLLWCDIHNNIRTNATG